MHYYTHNIGEFSSLAGLCGPFERGIAIYLIDKYAASEQALTKDEIAYQTRRIAKLYPFASESLIEDMVSLVIHEFFVEKGGAYVCPMIDEQIKRTKSRSEINRANASKPRTRKIRASKSLQDSANSESLANRKQIASEEQQIVSDSLLPNTQYPIPNTQLVNNPLTPLQGEKGEAAITSNVGSKEKERKRGTRLTLEKLPDDWRAYCEEEDPELDPDRVWADFRDYWTAKAGSGAVKLDWERTWQTNVRSYRDAPDWKRKPVLKPQSNEIDYSGWLTGDLG